jgi:gamma-glutamylcysteine synthetase
LRIHFVCSQVNLDFSDEADMVQMARLGIALQPIATALFANSPFRDGKPTGYLSWRSHVWTDTVSSLACRQAQRGSQLCTDRVVVSAAPTKLCHLSSTRAGC